MPSIVSNEGTYRGKPTAWAIGLSSGGYPQFVVALAAAEWWNAEEEAWCPWEEYDEGITGYLCLFGKDGKPLKNATQVMKVFNWDGASFDDLDEGDYGDLTLQFRCAEEEYNDVTRMKMQWIDVADAVPGSGIGSVDKMDTAERSALSRKFAKQLKGLSGGKVNVAKPPTTKPKLITKTKAKAMAPATDTKPTTAKPKRRTSPKVTVEYDYVTAWEAVVTKTVSIDDDDRAEAWSNMLDSIVGEKDEKDITAAEWASIVDNTVKELATH